MVIKFNTKTFDSITHPNRLPEIDCDIQLALDELKYIRNFSENTFKTIMNMVMHTCSELAKQVQLL